MCAVNLQGAISELITELFMINDGFSAGEKLTQIEKTAKKRFLEMSDEEIYNSLKETIKNDYYSDEFLTKEELDELDAN